MSHLLSVDFVSGLTQVVEQQQVMTLVQSEDVNLSEPVEGTASGSKGMLGSPFFLLLMVGLVLILFIRPNRDKDGEKFRNALQLDQEVVTSSGTFGKIKEVGDLYVILEIAKDMRIKVDKRYLNPVPTIQPQSQSKKKEKAPNKDEKA